TTTNDQTYNEAVSLGANATLASTSGTLTFADAVAAGANNLILQADTIALSGGADSVSGTGKIELAPAAAGDGVGIMGGAGKLQIGKTTLAALKDGFAKIVLGRDDGSGAVDVHAAKFSDPVVIESPSGSITVNGQITGTDNASVTLIGSGHTTTLNANIVTAGTPRTLHKNSLLRPPAQNTLPTPHTRGASPRRRHTPHVTPQD